MQCIECMCVLVWVGVFFCLASILKKKKKQDFEPNATGYLQTPPPKNRSQSITGAVYMTKGWLIFIVFSHKNFLHAIDQMVSRSLRIDSSFLFPKEVNIYWKWFTTFQNTWMSTRVWPDRLGSAFATAVTWVASSYSFWPGLAQNSLTSAFMWTRIWATY